MKVFLAVGCIVVLAVFEFLFEMIFGKTKLFKKLDAYDGRTTKPFIAAFKTKVKVVCLSLFFMPVVAEVYFNDWSVRSSQSVILEVGIAILAFALSLYMLLLLIFEPLQRFSLQPGIEISSVRTGLLISLFIFMGLGIVFLMLG